MALASTHHEIEELGNGVIRHVQHMKPIAYRSNGSLVAANSTWVDSGNPNRPHIVSAAPLMISAANDGIMRWHPTRDAAVYLEIGDPKYRIGGDLRTFDFANPTRNGNRIRWDKTAASLIYDHGGFFGKMGLVFHTSAYQNIDNREFAFPLTYSGLVRSGRNVLFDGSPVMHLRPFVAYDWDGDHSATIAVPHRFKTLAGIEYVIVTLPVEMDAMSRPVLDPTLELQPDATAGMDTTINSSNVTNNYGTAANVNIGEISTGTGTWRGLIQFDLSSIPATATVSSAVLSLWLFSAGNATASNDRTIRWFRVRPLRDWVEAQATWNIYKTSNNWSTAGCSDTTNDREATDIGSKLLQTTDLIDSQHDFTLTASAIQDWIDGTLTNRGLLGKADTEVNDMYPFKSSDNATAAQRPKLTIVYTVPAAARLFMQYRRFRQ